MSENIYSVKIKISKESDVDGVRYANVFQTGVCFSKTNKKAKEIVLENFKKHHEKNKITDVTTEIVECKKIRSDFVFSM